MDVLNIRHNGLKRFVEDGDPSGLPGVMVERIRNVLSFVHEMESVDELKTLPGWQAQAVSDDGLGLWSLSLSRNWRITLQISEVDDPERSRGAGELTGSDRRSQ
jgi:proteic killer suppression protein